LGIFVENSYKPTEIPICIFLRYSTSSFGVSYESLSSLKELFYTKLVKVENFSSF